MSGDSLAAHLEADAGLGWSDPGGELAARVARILPRDDGYLPDAHAEYIEAVDAARGAVRAARISEALALVRGRVRGGERLSWPLLQQAQGVVLGIGEPAPFRSGPAFAKGGRERYGYEPGLELTFAERLSGHGGGDGEVHPVLRAARAYLDVCFFHPFTDGNARAARVALDAILWGARVPVGNLRLVFAMPIPAGHRDAYEAWARLLARCCERAGGT